MKKLYILMAGALLAGAANAQTINFVREGQVIESGTTLNYNTRNVVFDYGDNKTIFMIDPEISIVSDEDVTVNVVADCTTGQTIQMCCGGQCEQGANVRKSNVFLTANTPLPTKFEYSCDMMTDEVPSIVTTELSVSKAQQLGGSECNITVVMDLGDSSVTLIESDKAFRYVDGEIRYDVSEACEASLYDTDGKCVIKAEIEGTGSISTDGLVKGIYVYKLGNKSGKIFVK